MLVGFLGLGRMGSRIVEKLLAGGHEVIVWNRSYQTAQEFARTHKKVIAVNSIADFATLQKKPHVFWSMVLFGKPTDNVLSQLVKIAEKDDVIADGANSFYKDTEKRFARFEKLGIHFLGIGVSGGILAPVTGFPLMVGGSEIGYKKIIPILDTLSKPHSNYAYFGKGGVGHFIKMIHNGVEYGQMQAIGEGFGVLDKGPYRLDLEKVADLWTKGTIVSGFLMERARDALSKDKKLEKTVGFIEENGEAKWTIAFAKKLKIPIQVIADSLKFRQQSQKSAEVQQTFAAKMVAALRHEFGGHNIKEK